MTKKFKESIDKGKAFGALLTDLSKTFDFIDHTLLIAKLSAFGVSLLSLILIQSYLSNRTQPIKINESFSDKTDIEFGAPQGSVLGPLLFNIDMIDHFYKWEDSDVAGYADDTKPYSIVTYIPSVALELQASATKQRPDIVSIDGIPLTASSHKKLLRVTIDSGLKFENHIAPLRFIKKCQNFSNRNL